MTIIRTTSENLDFKNLVKKLDAYLAIMDGDEHEFYNQFNKIDTLKNCIVIYDDNEAVACGAVKEIAPNAMEIKRMFTLPEKRRNGLASLMLESLETWSKELGYEKVMLETGKRQTEAVALYIKRGYQIIANYGQYIGIENSVCFEKEL